MNTYSNDYDDTPTRPTANPLNRLMLSAGAFVTIILAVPVGILIELCDYGVIAIPVGFIVSVASIPFIMLFWSNEVSWKEGWLTKFTIFLVSILTWFAQIAVSVIMVAVVVAAL